MHSLPKCTVLCKSCNDIPFIICSPTNRLYLTGFNSSFAYFLFANDKFYFITDFRYSESAGDFFSGCDIDIIGVTGSEALVAVKRILSNITEIGIDEDELLCGEFNSVKAALGINFINISPQIKKQRIVKDADEIKLITKAQSINDCSFLKVLPFIKAGVSEHDIKVELEYQMLKAGSERTAFDTIVASGVNSSVPHAFVSDRKIKKDEFVVIDFGASVCGYKSDMTRTICVGKPSEEMLKIYETVKNSFSFALSRIKEADAPKKMFEAFCGFAEEYGYKDAVLHGLGHGVGLDIHELPTLNSSYSGGLPVNSVIAVEPALYFKGEFGIRIEDLLLITQKSYKVLTKTTRDCIIL